jgi:transcription initiation protein SPT3
VSRLRTFLAWKDVRKNIKDDDEKGDALEIPGDTVEPAGADEFGDNGGDGAVSKKVKNKGIILPWDLSSFFCITPPFVGNDDDDGEGNDHETLRRLQTNDERTREMTREEYAQWAECRQASFTWRKAKRFKEWCQLVEVHDGGRVGEDVLDLLGFLCAEMVQKLGVVARRVMDEEEQAAKVELDAKGDGKGSLKRKVGGGCVLFGLPGAGKRAIEERHAREAYRILQMSGARKRAFIGLGLGRSDGGTRMKLVGSSL